MPLPSTGTYPISNKDVLSFTFDAPTYDPDRPVLIDPADPSRHYTHRSARTTVRRLIAGLHAAGLQPGDTVCIHSFNSLLYPLLVLAIIGAGGLSVGTNPSYTPHELAHAVRTAHIRFVLSEPEILPSFLAAARGLSTPPPRLFVLDGPSSPAASGQQSWRSLLSHGEADWIRFDDHGRSLNTTAQLFFTSGTSGLPKCAMTSHRNLVAEHQLFYEQYPRDYRYRVVLSMPFFHVGILPQVLVSALKEGREAYVMRRFELEPYLRYHAKYQITEMFAVPPMVVAIVGSGLADEGDKAGRYRRECSLRSVRNVTSGAAPLSGEMQRRCHALLEEGATFGQIWGMTETTSMATIVPWDVNRRTGAGEVDTWGSVGKPLPGVEMKLVDEAGRDVTEEKGRGELCVKGPGVVQGYYENERATRESWDEEGYFRTGDVVQLDKEGLMYVVERVKELIKIRGFQVAPAELEGVLTSHEGIVDAAVIGVPVAGEEREVARAYVVRRPGTGVEAEEVKRFMKERLARYKQIEGGIVFVDEIPKLPSGKILKRVLRERVKEELEVDKAGKMGPKL